MLRIVSIGNVIFSKHMLEKLIDLNQKIVGVCTTKNSNFNSDYYDIGKGSQSGFYFAESFELVYELLK